MRLYLGIAAGDRWWDDWGNFRGQGSSIVVSLIDESMMGPNLVMIS